MHEQYYIFGVIIVFSLVLLVLNSRTLEDSIMKGFWCADAAFCKKAELETFVLYLGDNVSYSGNSRHGYLLTANADGIILNNPIRMDFGRVVTFAPWVTHCKDTSVTIDWKDSPPTDPNAFPSKCRAAYYPKHGKLVFYNDDEVVACLWKDSQMSSLTSDGSLTPDSIKEEMTADGVDI